MRSPVPVKQQQDPALLGHASFAVLGVMLTLKCSLEINAYFSHSVPEISFRDFGLLLLMVVAFIVAGVLLSVPAATRSAGAVLLERITCSGKNWQADPLRSFCELFLCVSVVFNTYQITQHVVTALAMGLLSSWALVFVGEFYTHELRLVERAIRKSWGELLDESEPESWDAAAHRRIGCSLTLLSLYAWGACHLIYQHIPGILLASAIASLMCFLTLIIAKMCTVCSPVRHVGELLQDRLLNTASNWRIRPIRSATESCASMGVALWVYGATAQLILALQAGTFIGILTCLSWELISSPTFRARLAALADPQEDGVQQEAEPRIRVARYALGFVAAFTLFSPTSPDVILPSLT